MRKAQNKIEKTSEREIFFVFDRGNKALPFEGAGNADSGGLGFKVINEDYFLFGISSRADYFFKDPGEYGVVEVYTSVSYHAPWIDKVIENDLDYIKKHSTQERFS